MDWPIGANWHTQDADGEGVFHVHKPQKMADYWWSGFPYFPSGIIGDGVSWESSLIENPATALDRSVLCTRM